MKKSTLLLMLMTSAFTDAYAMVKEDADTFTKITARNHIEKSGDRSSDDEKKGDNQSLIKEIKSKISAGEKAIREQQNYEDVQTTVLVVGSTGEGKSTLVNYLAGKPLTVKYIRGKQYLESNDIVGRVKIGHSVNSETTIPNSWYDRLTKTLYFDCPGFDDTEGPVQDIPNAFFINKLLTTSKNIKILLVFSEPSLDGRALNFRKTLEHLSSIFKDQEELKKSVSCVFTKQTGSYDVREILTNFKLASRESQSFVQFLAGNGSKIANLPHPSKFNAVVGEDKSGNVVPLIYRDDILKNIQDSIPLKNPAFNIAVSNESLIVIGDLEKEISDELNDYMNECIIHKIPEHYDRTVRQSSKSIAELKKYFSDAHATLNNISREDSHSKVIQDIGKLTTHIGVKFDLEKIREGQDYLDFFHKINDKFSFPAKKWQGKFYDLSKKANTLSNPIITNGSQEYVVRRFSRVIHRWQDGWFGPWREIWSDGNVLVNQARLEGTFTLTTGDMHTVYDPWYNVGGEFERETYRGEH